LFETMAEQHPNGELCDTLCSEGTVSAPEIEAAFRSIDRGNFLTDSDRAYDNEPVKEGMLHLSAPYLYAKAVEELDLIGKESIDMLNVGSGTGYLSCIISKLLGPTGSVHGIEINPVLVEHANERIQHLPRELLDSKQLADMQFVCGSCFQLSHEQKYDRIYIGAGAKDSMLPYLLSLLNEGGILVGPFDGKFLKVVKIAATDEQNNNTAAQANQSRQRRKLSGNRRESNGGTISGDSSPNDFNADDYHSTTLSYVAFSPLQGNAPTTTAPKAASNGKDPYVRFLKPVWSPDTHGHFPESFRAAVKVVLMSSRRIYDGQHMMQLTQHEEQQELIKKERVSRDSNTTDTHTHTRQLERVGRSKKRDGARLPSGRFAKRSNSAGAKASRHQSHPLSHPLSHSLSNCSLHTGDDEVEECTQTKTKGKGKGKSQHSKCKGIKGKGKRARSRSSDMTQCDTQQKYEFHINQSDAPCHSSSLPSSLSCGGEIMIVPVIVPPHRRKPLPALPLDVWHKVLSFMGRDWFKPSAMQAMRHQRLASLKCSQGVIGFFTNKVAQGVEALRKSARLNQGVGKISRSVSIGGTNAASNTSMPIGPPGQGQEYEQEYESEEEHEYEQEEEEEEEEEQEHVVQDQQHQYQNQIHRSSFAASDATMMDPIARSIPVRRHRGPPSVSSRESVLRWIAGRCAS